MALTKWDPERSRKRRWFYVRGARTRRLLAGGAALAALAASPPVLAQEVRYPQTLLKPAGDQARALYEAMAWDIEFITFVFFIVSLITAFILIRFKHRDGEDGLPPQATGNLRWELGAWLVLIVGLIVMALHPLKAETVFASMPKGDDAIDVQVIGHQWWWEIRYPKLGIVTANELHIPTGTPVRIATTSVDVIHSFEIPRLGGKNDSLPGRWTKFWIEADEPGIYQGQCFELCGASHARMLARVIAHTPADFEAWVRARQNPQSQPESDLARAGEQTFKATCALCHTIDGTAAKGTIGPNLTAFGTRTSIGGGVLANTPENLAKWLADPAAIKPGSKMPNYNLSKEQIDGLVAYLMGLK